MTLVNIDLNKIRQEQPVENSNYNQASTSNNYMNLNDHNHSSTQEFDPLINNTELNKVSAPEILYEILVENNPAEIVSRLQSCTSENENLDLLELADVFTNSIPVQSSEDRRTEIHNELMFDSNVLEIDDQAS